MRLPPPSRPSHSALGLPPHLTCRHESSTVSHCATMSTASRLLMNSHTPSLARIMKASCSVSSSTVWSGSDVTPTLRP